MNTNRTIACLVTRVLLTAPLFVCATIHVWAATDRLTFNLKGSWNESNAVTYAVRVVGPHAYIASGSRGLGGRLQILAIDDPANPRLVGEITTGCFAYDTEVVGNFAYVADFCGGLRIIDVSDPTRPVSVGSYDSGGVAESAHALRVIGSLAYLAPNGINDFQIIDVSDPARPVRVGGIAAPCEGCLRLNGFAKGVEVIGNRVFIAGGRDNPADDTFSAFLEVFDATQPTNLVSLGRAESPERIFSGIAVANGFAYLVGENNGLSTFDVTGAMPTFVNGYEPDLGFSLAARYANGYLFIAGEYLGLEAFDVSNPTQPKRVGRFPLGVGHDDGWDVDVIGNHAYLAANVHGLLVFELKELPFIRSIRRNGNNVILSWDGAPGVKLQRAASLANPEWSDVPGSEGQSSVQLPTRNGEEFFRLIRP